MYPAVPGATEQWAELQGRVEVGVDQLQQMMVAAEALQHPEAEAEVAHHLAVAAAEDQTAPEEASAPRPELVDQMLLHLLHKLLLHVSCSQALSSISDYYPARYSA